MIQTSELLQKGARLAVNELATQLADLIEAVPTIRPDAQAAFGVIINPGRNGHVKRAEPATSPKRRTRPKMTAAQRREVSKRMSRYWAARRAEKAEQAKAKGAK